VPSLPVNGGPPTSPFFYKNPQYAICLDPNFIIDKQKAITAQTEVLVTYKSTDEASVRVFLCKAGEHSGRATGVDETNIVNQKELKEAFRPIEGVANGIITGAKPYTVVVSCFDRSMPIGGTLTLESDAPMLLKPLPEEGAGFIKQVFSGSFEF